MPTTLHPRNDTDSLYVSRKRERRHTNYEDSVDTIIQGFEECTKKSKERRITVTAIAISEQTEKQVKLENRNGEKQL